MTTKSHENSSLTTDPHASNALAGAYLRHPDVHGDLIAFTAADDVWLAPLAGGRAWRLTDQGAPVSYPRFSPDGDHIAFVSRASGGPEAWVAAADGQSAPRRLTYWGKAATRVAGWLPDGRILVSTPYGATSNQRDAQLWALDLDGAAELLPLGRSGEAAIHPDGTTVVATPWRKDQATWKHYQGGTAVKLWISHQDVPLDAPVGRHAERSWEPLLDELLASKLRIAWYGDRLIFASDTPGAGAARNDRASANLWSVALDGSDLQVHTRLTSEQGYLREPATDGSTIVFSSRGRLFAMDSLDAAPREIDLQIAGLASARADRIISPSENLLAMRPTHDARSSVVEWRGTAHVLTHRGGPARLLAGQSGLRLREVRPLGRTPFALYVTDESAQHDVTGGGVGSDTLHLRRLDAGGETVRLDLGEVGRILHAIPSPDGTRVALGTHDNRVLLATLRGVIDPARGAHDGSEAAPHLDHVREIGRSSAGEISDLAWSPDSRWLAWAQPITEMVSRLWVSDTQDADPSGRAMTSGRYRDAAPAFSADGKHLAFLSLRTFDTVYDDMVFDLGFVNAERPFLLPLEATTRDPFGPEADGWGAAETDKDGADKDGDSSRPEQASAQQVAAPATAQSAAGSQDAHKPPTTEVDLEAVESRVVPFPVESGSFSHLSAVSGGFVWLRHPQESVLGSTRAGVEGDDPKPTLELWKFADHKVITLAEGVTDLSVSGDGSTLVIHQGDDWVSIPADRKAEDEDPARIVIGTDRLRLSIDPVAERRGMLWDNYRIMAQQYWRADMDGQDWHAMTSWYDAAIERVISDDDFQDLMWEVVGELGTSHAYVMGSPYQAEHRAIPASLGADLERQGDRLVITRIPEGDSSDPDARSPLLAPGIAARTGDAIVQVDGRNVDPARGLEPLLIGSADRPTELVLEREGERRRVVVVPLNDDGELRYQGWVASRRELVEELSGGRLGYLHIPDMVSSGWAQMHRDLREATTKEGLVVDVRYNSGGHTSQLVTDRLARRVVSWGYPRYETPDTYPALAPRGSVVLVTNQEAGSDGDIVNAVSQAMNIGPVIGTRTWGGVIGIDGRYDLVDGTGITQPKYASWFAGVDWSIENYGVDPDIEVPFPPNAWVAGEDPQLSRGVEEALALLAETPAATAPPLPAPRFGSAN